MHFEPCLGCSMHFELFYPSQSEPAVHTHVEVHFAPCPACRAATSSKTATLKGADMAHHVPFDKLVVTQYHCPLPQELPQDEHPVASKAKFRPVRRVPWSTYVGPVPLLSFEGAAWDVENHVNWPRTWPCGCGLPVANGGAFTAVPLRDERRSRAPKGAPLLPLHLHVMRHGGSR